MSKAVFLLGEFVFNMVKVLMAYELIRANATAKCSERTERIVSGVVAVMTSGLTVWNTALTGFLFSNSQLWLTTVIIAIMTWRSLTKDSRQRRSKSCPDRFLDKRNVNKGTETKEPSLLPPK